MNTHSETWGWQLATNSDLLLKIFGEYPSFHDSAIRSICMHRNRHSSVTVEGKPLSGGRRRGLVDLVLEIEHDRYGAPRASDYLVVVDFLDLGSSQIDLNAMLEEASVMDITLTKESDGLIKLDLMPNVGLDIRLTCREVVVRSVQPYVRDES
jgi:hypothetical protein